MRFVLAVLSVLMVAGPSWAAPEPDLWERWTAHDAASTTTVDHSAWGDFLNTYLTDDPAGVNPIDYAGVTATDKAALDAYVASLAATEVAKLNRDEQFAYWINFYNALTVKVILDHMPVETIRDIDISPGFFANGPWRAKLIVVEDEEISLDDIEHRILRPIWNDPRIHYAVNCAAIGCPDLMAKPYSPATMEADLEANARAFVNDPRGVRIDGDEVTVSKIYDWFDEDFGASESGILEHLRQYAAPDLKAALQNKTAIDGYEYDWSLNAK